MSFDGIMLSTIKTELEKKLCGARIDKIYQPQKQQIILHLRQKGASYKLLLSSLAQEARVHLISQTASNPAQPPLFCMVLRKHLEGGRILSFTQPGLERVLEINCEVLNELGDKTERKIIIEIMGKHSNIILVNPEKNKIIDALQRVPASLSRYRQVLPGLSYHYPPPQDKIIPWQTEQKVFYERLLSLPLTTKLNKALLKTCQGLSPQSINELIFRTGLESHLTLEYCGEYELSTIWQELEQLGTQLEKEKLSPEVIVKDNLPLAFSAFALTSYPLAMRRRFSEMSAALEFFYLHKNKMIIKQQRKEKLTKIINKEIQRCEKKAALQLEDIVKAKNADQYRLWGELLTANLHCLSQGKEARVSNYYDPSGKIEIIPLKPQLSVSENAQRYYSKYQKCKNATVKAQKQLEETKNELDYLHSLANSLDNVTDLTEMEEIHEEIQQAGYLKKPSKTKKRKQQPSLPWKINLDSWILYVGKNNRQNDLLTMKIAKKDDLWFHTKNIPGSHVLIKNPQNKVIPPEIIEKAAMLAAYHSQARHSTNVPVDYTKRQNVWKPQGAKPGFVLYTKQNTFFVTPEPEIIKELIPTKL